MNVDSEPIPLPAGELLIASGPLSDGHLPAATTAWLQR